MKNEIKLLDFRIAERSLYRRMFLPRIIILLLTVISLLAASCHPENKPDENRLKNDQHNFITI